MGYKHTLVSLAGRFSLLGLSFSRKLPTYYQGYWIWLTRNSWETLFSRYEPYTGRAMKIHLRAGDTFWDVGAHIGWFSLLASKIVGSNGKVFSFEPSPDVFNMLSANTQGLSSIRAIQCGVGNTDAVAPFAAQGTSTAASFLEEVTELYQHYHFPKTPIQKIETNIRKADNLLKELGAPHVIKIDVEGFELEVLKGATGLLLTARPILIMEIHPIQLNLSGGSEVLLFQFLKEHGYGWEVINRSPAPYSHYSVIAEFI
jgi:FkbM family methyltransferase